VAEKRQAAKDLEHSLLLLAGQPYGAGGGGAVPDGEKIRKMATSLCGGLFVGLRKGIP